jgi:hypothetical protein
VAGPPPVITCGSAFAARQVRVATAGSHTNALPVPGRTTFSTRTTRPRRPADEVYTGVCPVTGMSARRPTTILPEMTMAEAIATTHIHSVASLTGDRTALVTTCPCRAPHYTISNVGLSGGGHVSRPGDVSLAHHGVRFLDELPEFRRHVLEVLPQPLEKSIISRQSPAHYRRRRARRPVRGHGACAIRHRRAGGSPGRITPFA